MKQYNGALMTQLKEKNVLLAAKVDSLNRAHEEIRELNADLERRVAERTAGLEGAVKELEAFSYSVSHDLRAPLRGIDGFARALQEAQGSRLDPEGNRLLAVIRAETRSMGRLIDDLLAFSRASRQPIDSSLIDMTELAEGTFQNLVEAMPIHAMKLVIKPLPPSCGDRSMLRQVFANLLSNAIKFSARRAAPAIEVGGRTDGVSNLYFVKDNGAGFDERQADRLFGVFQRLHRQQEFEGTGVGLAIVQRIVGRHGGKVWAEGKMDAGATFYFSLPCSAKPGAENAV